MYTKLISTLALFAIASATQISRPATKDSTIMRSTVSCADCPNRNCYECTYGETDILRANTGGMAWIRSIVGFRLPEDVNPSDITECTVQFPAFTKLPEYGFNMTVTPAQSSDWDESTITANNAPGWTEEIQVYPMRAKMNPPLLDVTHLCQDAGDDGQFSFYIGAEFGSYEIWSKDSGNPAVLHIFYD